MSASDNSEYETARQQYEDEAKRRWGGTDAYKESRAKTSGYLIGVICLIVVIVNLTYIKSRKYKNFNQNCIDDFYKLSFFRSKTSLQEFN